MFLSTLASLCCPFTACRRPLKASKVACQSGEDLVYGTLSCEGDHAFPVLAGVAVLVPDPEVYLKRNAHSVLAHVALTQLDPPLQVLLQEARGPRPDGWSMESDFATSMYVANHYLLGGKGSQLGSHTFSKVIREIIEGQWRDHPLSRMEASFRSHGVSGKKLLDLGCSVGGAINRLGGFAQSSLGVDYSFAAIAWARKLVLGETKTSLPADRLWGSVSKVVSVQWEGPPAGKVDFVVGDALLPPVPQAEWDIVLALGVLDIVRNPLALLRSQTQLTAPNGFVVQSSPYFWAEESAHRLRDTLPPEITSSAAAVEWLYRKAGIELVETQDDVPWVFFKFDRRIEVSAVHWLLGRKAIA